MPSTVIRFFTYDPDRRHLTIVFRSGRRYVYREVPKEVFEAFAAAFSKGEFFNSQIRDHYAFERVESARSM
jgi:hypothetical protein